MEEFSLFGADILREGAYELYALEYRRYAERLEAMFTEQNIKRSASNQPYPSDGSTE